MRIAFYGSSLLSAYWNGAATYYRGLLSQLAARGHSVTFYEPDAFDRQSHRDIDPPDWARVFVWPATEAAARVDTLARELVARMRDAHWDEGAAPSAVMSVLAASVPEAETVLLRAARARR